MSVLIFRLGAIALACIGIANGNNVSLLIGYGTWSVALLIYAELLDQKARRR